MNIPPEIQESRLYHHLQSDEDLHNAIFSLRSVAKKLADTVSRTVPSFTDHSIKHMDALWTITDRVLTDKEVTKLTTAEAFLLASGFYLHDIGMAYAATSEGLARCRASDSYANFMAGLPENRRREPEFDAQAVALTVRKLHGNAAIELASSPIPGTDVYLFDSYTIRNEWGETCGTIAASHHWNIERVERDLGKNGIIPLPGGRKGDLGYVAVLLRIIDYAHISRERASVIERLFRQPLAQESLLHWLAQENIDGPERDNNDLVYRAARPIANVDAWWLYYEMIAGLDAEIRAVHRYLDRRSIRQGRFSLKAVRGAASPQEASSYIPTAGFLPIEVNLRTSSTDKLVQLLAGESLYGPDPMAAVRELIQNARDAVMLKRFIAESDADKALLSLPIKLEIKKNENGYILQIRDWGVGMSSKIMTDYLISIASDYWSSQQFYDEFPSAAKGGFQPAGKFGIGFLSAFMLGDEITVESNRVGEERTRLSLHGVGRRGELRTTSSETGSGTVIQIQLKESVIKKLHNLPDLLQIYAPMVSHSLEVEVEGQVTKIDPGWIFKMPANEFHVWTTRAIQKLKHNRSDRNIDEQALNSLRRLRNEEKRNTWPLDWPEFADSNTRLLASFEGSSLVCLKGLAVQAIFTPGFVGVIDLASLSIDVSRQKAFHIDLKDILARAKSEVHSIIVKNLNVLANRGLIINKLRFLHECVSTYGVEVLRDSSVAWISSIKFPGEVELLSSATLVDKLRGRNSFFLAFDTGPWTAMKRWENLNPPPHGDELAVVLDKTGYQTPGYQRGDDEIIGILIEIWPEYTKAALFYAIIGLVCEAWQTDLDKLTSQSGWHHFGTSIWGRFTRP